jgi:UPF0755 protein
VTLTARGRAVVVLGIILGLLGLVVLAGFLYLRSLGLYGSSDPGSKVAVDIPKGASVDEIGELLESKDVIPSAFGFRITVFIEGGAEDIKAGTYELPRGLTPKDALSALLGQEPASTIAFVSVTFPEGAWLTEFAEILDRETHISGDEFLELATSGTIRSRYQPKNVETLEGLLFPSTYQIIKKDDARSVTERLVEEFDKKMGEVNPAAARSLGVTPYELVIVASMVEAEARIPEERPRVARVIYNRLSEGMPLGIDATIIYALEERKRTLTESDLAVDSPYNTRVVPGLPPTPIGAPGAEALKAAAAPADGGWLYYVLADCEGHHAFSETYDEFLADKARYQTLYC